MLCPVLVGSEDGGVQTPDSFVEDTSEDGILAAIQLCIGESRSYGVAVRETGLATKSACSGSTLCDSHLAPTVPLVDCKDVRTQENKLVHTKLPTLSVP
jgi:hypothetical protein